MAAPTPLAPDALRRTCDASRFKFKTTAELKDFEQILGQERAMDAIAFGMGIRREGFNLFALGPTGVGKHDVVMKFLSKQAKGEKAPDDWCYVNNFKDTHRPCALRLPPGKGTELRKEMDHLVEGLRTSIPAALSSDDYQSRRQAIEERQKEYHEQSFREIEERGRKKDVALVRTPMGLALAPQKEGEVLTPDQFERLPEKEQKRIQADIEELQEALRAALRQAIKYEEEGREQIKALNREVTSVAVEHLMASIRKKYEKLPDVIGFLESVQQDVVENAVAFLPIRPQQQETFLPIPPEMGREAVLNHYKVNVLVDHSENHGAPVVYEDNPSMQNLLGRIEHIATFGTLSTNFTLIKPGAMHRANGGYLVLDARRLLQQPLAWESLKGALRSHHIRIESLGERLNLVSTISLEPQPIPLDVKVILTGERILYYLLSEADPDFGELFKVMADFDDRMSRDEKDGDTYAGYIGTLARSDKLHPLDPGAVTRVIEQSARMAQDSEKLTTHREKILDLLREADYWARSEGKDVIGASHVERAVAKQIYRSDRLRQLIHEEITRGTILIDTAGEKKGQINGLSVAQVGGFAFGTPSRITARVRMGKGEVVDIEREVEMGGPIHSKGVMILSGFLGARYALAYPLTLSASLVFEQNYGGVEGDSASLAETCALLSALAEVPLRQDIAVTGSLNQHGEVQAVGGVNDKIEGFFDICKARGLDGKQGVILPASNVKHLMLRPDVVEAVRKGEFSIWAVSTVDEATALLTGLDAGERDAEGWFPENTFNYLVEMRLVAMAELAREREAEKLVSVAESAKSSYPDGKDGSAE